MATRFVIEGTWSGYVSSQMRVVHRTVHDAALKKLRAWAGRTRGITFTDGTMLFLSVRDAEPRERIKEIHGYDSLIADCARYGVASVNALQAACDGTRAAAQSAGAGEGFYSTVRPHQPVRDPRKSDDAQDASAWPEDPHP